MKTLDVIVHAISLASATSIDVHPGPSLIRQYSLCNSLQEEDRYLICVRRDDAERTVVHHSDRGDTVRTGLPAELLAPEPDTAVHVCGPDGFMTHVTAKAAAAGRQPGQLHTERFAPAVPLPAGGEVATEFTVRIASTGIGYPVPADRTVADVLTAHGVEVGLSCEQGSCGACPTPVLAGEPDHRDEIQTPDERAANDRITICCSGARTPELLLGL